MASYRYVSVDQVYVVDDWEVVPSSPTGTRDKETLTNPHTHQDYLFKLPRSGREHQLWSELTASFIAGDMLGWDVQHAGIGVRHGQYGNLLKYVYHRSDPELLRSRTEPVIADAFLEGWHYYIELDPQYDRRRGTRHTLPLVLGVYDKLIDNQMSAFWANISRREYMDFWARIFAFDTLISNTDRHAENWAIVVTSNGTPPSGRMAALYDNGTSLGCNVDHTGLQECFDDNGEILAQHLTNFRRKGRHHVRLKEPGKRGARFEELCKAFLSEYPEGRHFFEAAATIEVATAREFMADTASQLELPEPFTFTPQRQQHICAILQIGVQRIHNVLQAQSA